MTIKKVCLKCGSIVDDESEFCSECGFNLANNAKFNEQSNSEGFFNNLTQKANIPVLIFSFVIFGVFLFIGSFFWYSFVTGGSIDLLTYILLTVVFSVFFGGIFLGYFGCFDKSYVLPNFSVYLGSIFAVILSVIGLIFTFLMGIFANLSSALSSFGGSSQYSGTYQPTTPVASYVDVSGIFKIILFILLIPVASYFGVYLGFFLKQNI